MNALSFTMIAGRIINKLDRSLHRIPIVANNIVVKDGT